MNNQKKVLVIKLASLGDVLASSHIFKGIGSKENIKVDHLVMEHCKGASLNNPFINNQITIPAKDTSIKILLNYKFYISFFRMLFNRYDYVFLFHRSVFLQLLVLLMLPKKKFGFKGHLSFLFTNSIPYDLNTNRSIQEWKMVNLSNLSYKKPNKLNFYPLLQNKKKFISLPDKYICINPGGGNLHANADTRCWPIDNYAQFLNSIGLSVIILGRGNDDDKRAMELVTKLEIKYFNFVSKLSLDETADVMKKSLGYLGNDSALAFLAAAIKVPAVILYGPTSPVSAMPIGLRGKVLVGKSWCGPCYSPFDGTKGQMYKCKNNICMQNIPVTLVVETFQKVIRDAVNKNI